MKENKPLTVVLCFFSLFSGSFSHCDATTTRATAFSSLSRRAVAELKMPPGSLGRLLQHHLNPPTTNPTQPLVTQMQPPLLPPPPHPNFQSVHFHTQLPAISDLLLISNEPPATHSQTSVVTSEILGTTLQYLPAESQSHLTITSSRTQFQHQVSDELLIEPDSQGSNIGAVSLASQITEPFTETSVSQPSSEFPVDGSFGFLKLDSYLPTSTQSSVTQTKTSHSGSVSQSSASQAGLHQSQTQPHQLVTKSHFYQSYNEPTSTQTSQTKLERSGQPLHQKTHRTPSPTLSQFDSQQSFTQSLFPKFHLELSTIQPSTQPPSSSVTKPQQSQIHSQPSPTLPKPTSTIPTLPQTQPQSSPTQHPLLHSQAPLPQTFQPSVSTIYPPDQTSDSSTLVYEIPVVHQVNTPDQGRLNTSQQGEPVQSAKSPNDTEWLKRNTSQSPMTSNDPR